MSEFVKLAAKNIRKLQVQGARNVAIAAVKAIQTQAQETKAKDKTQFLAELKKAQDLLAESRETEPLMRNAMHRLIVLAENADTGKVSELIKIISDAADQF